MKKNLFSSQFAFLYFHTLKIFISDTAGANQGAEVTPDNQIIQINLLEQFQQSKQFQQIKKFQQIK